MGERNLREQGETNGFGQLEDKVMKTAAQFFGEDLLPYIGERKNPYSCAYGACSSGDAQAGRGF